MKRLSLSGAWLFRQANTLEWIDAQVPGSVHVDLLRAGCIPDPFTGTNEKQVAWVAESDWEYRRSFQVEADLLADEHIDLVFDGLDTLAEVWLNGVWLGSAENMFRQYRWEVKNLLKTGENELRILFASTVNAISKQEETRSLMGVPQGIAGAPHVRKAPCQFGWDWGPQLPPTGIWKDVRLEGSSLPTLGDVYFRQTHLSGAVRLSAQIQVESTSPADLEVLLRVVDPEGREFTALTAVTGSTAEGSKGFLELLIDPALLWWPNGYGDQPLYRVDVCLMGGRRELDRRSYTIGLRTVELKREKDAYGESFTFFVNGTPIFARGSDWIPADSFPTRITDAHLEHLVWSAAEANQNMLRVWGGGFYEEDRFYDLCDRYGLLVWQDFVFACSVYPLDDPSFVENVHQEVIQNVRRLRHRASLALWCGNNEMEWSWENWGLWISQELVPLRAAYEQFFYHTLPEWLAVEDPDRAYWSSSPSANDPFWDSNSPDRGDAHYWDVWHGRKPFTAYREVYPRFMSEFGFQSLPPLATIRTYARESDWDLSSSVMIHHQRCENGNSLMAAQMADGYRMPKDFPSMVYMTMILQAEGIRYGVEHWRRHKHRVSGTLYWQLNDCWPVASWSSIDYFGRWKALHYAARRFYAPVLLSIQDDLSERGACMSVYVTSDIRQAWQGEVAWKLTRLDGEVLDAKRHRVCLEPQESRLVCALDFEAAEGKRPHLVFICELIQDGQVVGRSLAPFVPNKDLALEDPRLETQVSLEEGEVVVSLRAWTLARFVEVSLEGADVVFSDNYFDVLAGETVHVRFRLPEGWSLEKARDALRVKSLVEAAETCPDDQIS